MLVLSSQKVQLTTSPIDIKYFVSFDNFEYYFLFWFQHDIIYMELQSIYICNFITVPQEQGKRLDNKVNIEGDQFGLLLFVDEG